MFVLIHSPLVGPLTWGPVAERLVAGGLEVRVPVLQDRTGEGPCWQQQADGVALTLHGAKPPWLLVGHSGAGALLPAIRQALGGPVAGYIFVDAGIHRDGLTRLEAMQAESPEFATQLRGHLVSGGRFPEWEDDQLRPIIPDGRLRTGLLAELRPRPLAFFEEPISIFAAWPDAPCGYVQFSSAYDAPAAQARAAGWPFRSFMNHAAGHFHMLVDPVAVAGALIELTVQMHSFSG